MMLISGRRRGLSLIEVLVAIAIIALLIGLLLPAIQSAREAGLLASTKNSLRQMILGTHQFVDENAGMIKDLPSGRSDLRNPKMHSLFSWIAPYAAGIDVIRHPYDFPVRVPLYVGKNDCTLSLVPYYIRKNGNPVDPDECSYGYNMYAFDQQCNFPGDFTDGLSNTLAFCEKLYGSGDVQMQPPQAEFYHCFARVSPPFGATINERLVGPRRATFADARSGDVMPVTDPATLVTGPSRPTPVFFHRPPSIRNFNPFVPSTMYRAGLPVALCDGSVRVLAPVIHETVFWAMITHNTGDRITEF